MLLRTYATIASGAWQNRHDFLNISISLAIFKAAAAAGLVVMP
jgi:hypothetical protein